jgi:DNA-binding LytR/AlgR family response regulator
MLVLFLSFIYLANFEMEQMGPNSSNILLLAVVLYLVVFGGSFLLTLQQLFESYKEIEEMKAEKMKKEKSFLELTSNRKTVQIPYENIVFIESLTDYIKVHSSSQEEIISKEKISVLEEKLPEFFVRIHRSFIVNSQKIIRFNNNEVELKTDVLSIGRTYKKQALSKLKLKG